MDEEIAAYFEGKPDTYELFKTILARLQTLGPFEVTVASQISLGIDRKFAWFWLYNVTKKNPSGILHTMLRIDRRLEDPNVRNIEQVTKNGWNHQIVIPRSITHRADGSGICWKRPTVSGAGSPGRRRRLHRHGTSSSSAPRYQRRR